jgi:predicted ATPase/class 3 adenylate cyclase
MWIWNADGAQWPVMSESLPDAPVVAALPTGTVTVLLSDVEGSTRLWEADAQEAARAITRHYELIGAAISLHGGLQPLEQGEGDSVVGAFARASDAVAAALDVQRAFNEEPWPGDHPVRVRIALHTGEVQLRDDNNYYGPVIIRCARLRAAARGGQTLLSEATRDLVVDRLPDQVALRDLGSHRFKDLGRAEQVWQLCHPEIQNDFAPLLTLDAMANNLPSQLTAFIGRDDELTELRATITIHRLVTLTGAGGCGKTRLALQAAADLFDLHSEGTWLVELAPVTNPGFVSYAVASALGLRKEAGRPLTDTICDQLAEQRIVLILDNCEHVLDAAVELVTSVLQSAPGVRLVVTSREPLGVPGEVTWRVPSLDDDTATRLFIDRAALVRPGFAPDDGETEIVASICRRLDGIPLAIELAAARTRMMAPARIAAALDDRFRLLTGGSRTLLPRQQTLETSVAWSYDLLDDQERSVLRRLSVFGAGFTLEAAEFVCADDLVDRDEVLELLSRLVDKSLVQVDRAARDERFRLLDTIRMYARERLLESGEGNATRDLHLDYFVGLAERVEPELMMADGASWVARLQREHDNLRSALEWADAHGHDALFLRLVTALTLFWELGGHLGEARRWFRRALAREGAPSSLRARALWGAAHVSVYADDFATASQRAPQALQMAEAVGDEWAMARALNTLGYLQMWFAPEESRATLVRSLELGRSTGDNWAVADGLKMITSAWLIQDDLTGIADSRCPGVPRTLRGA